MLQISSEDVNSQQEKVKLKERSLCDRSKAKFIKYKLIQVSLQVGEFSIVNIIGWFDPASGFCVGFCFFMWHLVQVLSEQREENKE